MSNTKYGSDLYILTKQQIDQKGNNVGNPPESIKIPVHSFEVEGGANRKINLNRVTEGVIFSEFEQARKYNTLIFYVPPTNDFLGIKLMNLSGKNWQQFDFSFTVNVFTNGKKTQTLTLTARTATFREPPVPVGTTPALLMLKVRIVDPELIHGQLNPKGNYMDYEQI